MSDIKCKKQDKAMSTTLACDIVLNRGCSACRFSKGNNDHIKKNYGMQRLCFVMGLTMLTIPFSLKLQRMDYFRLLLPKIP